MGAPQARIRLLAQALGDQGVKVVVHTGFPTYPAGALLGGYRNRPWLRERLDGVEVLRSAVYPSANRGFGRRLLNHAAFAASATATASLVGRADVIVAETPPLFLAAASVAYARAKRAGLILHVADRWPASAVELGVLRSARAIAAARAVERFAYRHADLIVAPTQGIVETLQQTPEAAGRCRRVWPTVDTSRFQSVPPARADNKVAPLKVVYAGTIGLAQGVRTLVEAARLAGPEIVNVTIAGDGAEASSLAEAADAEGGLDHVRLVGAVAPGEVSKLLAQADVAVVLLRDVPLFRAALPTKLLEAMAAARPVVLSAPSGEAGALLEGAGAGVVVAPEDPAALAQALRELRDHPDLRMQLGTAGRRFSDQNLGATRSARAWLSLIEDAVPLAERG